MVKAAIYLAGFYIVYFLFLSRDTMYRRNRAFILLSVLMAFLMPFFTINLNEQSNIAYFGKRLSEVLVTAISGKTEEAAKIVAGFKPEEFIFKVYVTGIIIFGIRLLVDIISLLFLIYRNKGKEGQVIFFTGFNTSGFSALGHIFINKSLGQEDISEITRHEKSHLGQYHFLDVLFIKIVQMVQWFNPVIYLFNRSLRIVHEYQADLDCLRTGLPVIKYLNLLFCHAFKTQKFKLNNSFSNPSLIKKRMIMMTKKRTITLANFKILIVLPVTILLLVFISSCRISGKLSATKSEIAPPPPPPPPPEIFVVVEEMPTFPGGEQALMEFIYANIQYPEMAKKNNIQGKEIIRFAVMADGYVDYVQVLKSVDPELDKEAIRVIKMLPVWTPGKQGGKPVNVWYNVPVTFQLK